MKDDLKRPQPLEILVGLLMVLLVATVFIQVVLRYVTYQPLAWTEELSRLLFIWICMVGTAIGAQRGTHFAVTIVIDYLPSSLKRTQLICVALLETAFAVILVWAGIVVTGIAHAQSSTAFEFPMSLPYASIVFAGVLMAAFNLRRAWRVLRATQ